MKYLLFLILILGINAIKCDDSIQNVKFIKASDRFYISTAWVDFVQAYATCKRYGWELATERDANETALLEAAITDTTTVYWLGGVFQEDALFKNQWIWLESGEEIKYTNWRKDEPEIGSDQYLCMVKSEASKDGQWFAGDCSKKRASFICKTNINEREMETRSNNTK